VLLSDGITPVTVGQTLTVAQLTSLEFVPALNVSDDVSALTYSVSDPGGHSATGSAMLAVAAATPPVTQPAALTVAVNSGATPIGIAAPTDSSFAASALSVQVTSLPANGTVLLLDGVTPVIAGGTLTSAQLAGLEFAPTPGAVAQTSSFTYNVSDPTGATTSGSATLGIGPSNAPLVTTGAKLQSLRMLQRPDLGTGTLECGE